MSLLHGKHSFAQNSLEDNAFSLFQSQQPNDVEGRILNALGLARGPLPEAGIEWLRRYYRYLNAQLALPFEAEYAEDVSGYRQVVSPIVVTAILPPDEDARSETLGILCRAVRGQQAIELPLVDVELTESAPNSRLIEDYWYWFWNWRFDPKI
jgi:hypothetical protein